MADPSKSTPQRIGNAGGCDQSAFGSTATWLAQNFARHWYADACREAADKSPHARRREIVFTVACAEAYPAEWARDLVGPEIINDVYLPAVDGRGIKERWKAVVKKLHANHVISACQNFKPLPWNNFVNLVNLRDGLLHARANRPYVPGSDCASQTMSKVEELQKFAPGEARDRLKMLILDLTEATDTNPPSWL